MRPYPAAIRPGKGKHERVEHLIRAQPDVLVIAHVHTGMDALGFLPDPAIDPIAGHDEIGVRQLSRGRHFAGELDTDACAQCPADQDVQQTLPPDAVAERGVSSAWPVPTISPSGWHWPMSRVKLPIAAQATTAPGKLLHPAGHCSVSR